MSSSAPVYRVEQLRAMERHAIDTLGISGYRLMQAAGRAALASLQRHWPRARQVLVLCGGGNNGGDGYELARLARAAGLTVELHSLVAPERLHGEALQAASAWRSAGGTCAAFDAAAFARCDVVVDALLGIGVQGNVRTELAAAIAALNTSGRPVLALDVPSGLDADSGEIGGHAVRATVTITFIAAKAGLYFGAGPACSGLIEEDDLGVAAARAVVGPPLFERLRSAELGECLPVRARDDHKGRFGHVLIVGGGPGMPGAARLAGEACLRVGAGLVTVASAPECVPAIACDRPELMCIGVGGSSEVTELCARADVVALGPGLGQSQWSRRVALPALTCGKRLVADADALNLIAAGQAHWPAGAIMTPHPGEAARLLGLQPSVVQADRLSALRQLVARFAGVIVLKGAGTLIGQAQRVTAYCEAGNPGMATAGMGDVLTGIIAGLLAQCGDPWRAARAGVLLHGLAGDSLASRNGRRGLLALELAAEIPAVLQRLAP